MAASTPRDAHQRYAALLEQIAADAPLPETLDALARYVEDELPGASASVLLLDDDGVHVRTAAAPRLPAAYSAAIDGMAIGPGVGSCGTAAFERAPVMVEDIEVDPRWAAFRSLARAHGLRACWSTPVLSRRRLGPHAVLGTFAVYYRAPRAPDAHALEVLARAEFVACIAIEADRAQAALREREAEFRAFVDHASDAFFVHAGGTGTVVDVNLQACQSLGYTRDELIGAAPALFDAVTRGAAMPELQRRLDAGGSVTFDSIHTRKDGSTFPVEVRIRMFTSRGRPFGLALVRDVTARRALEEQLQQAQKMEAIGRLAGGVAHDFNNLLTVINGYAEGLLADLPAGAARDDVAVIRDAGNRAAALTAQLLAFSRRTIIAPRPINLTAMVARLARMFERVLGERITLVTDLAAGLPTVMADGGQLEQVLLNLVVNAKDAMPAGGTLTIATSERASALLGRQVCLVVEDTGEGMPEDVRARVFEPFFTTKPQGQGSGLGLATVYGIVRQAGGYVQVESRVGHGSQFTVSLPASDAVEVPVARSGATQVSGAEVVLVVEDEEGVRRLIVRGLEEHGYRVLAAADGAAALQLEAAHAGPIELLITDVLMPGMTGREVADAVKRRRPAIHVLFISGYTDDEVLRHGVVVGKDAFFQKPFTPLGLLAKVRDVLDRGGAGG